MSAEYWARDARDRISPGDTREDIEKTLGAPTYEEWNEMTGSYSLHYQYHPAPTILGVVGLSLLAITILGLIVITSTAVQCPFGGEVHESTAGFVIRFDQTGRVTEIFPIRKLSTP